MKVKSIISSILGLSLLASSAVMAESTSKTDLKIWCWDEYFNIPAAQEAAQRYMAKHPNVNITVENVENTDVVKRLEEALAAKNYKGLPDIVLLEDTRAQKFITTYTNFFQPLSQVDVSKFVDFKVAVSSIGDTHYGVPFDSGVVGNFIRSDIFQRAGYTLEDLQNITWDEFIEIGKRVKEKTGVYLTGYDPNDLSLLRIIMQSAGSWYCAADGSVDVAENMVLKEGFKILKKLQDNDLVYYYDGWDGLLESFASGQVATVIQGCWITPSIEANKDQSGLWSVIPLPKLKLSEEYGEATHYSNLGGSQWFINNISGNGYVAEDFLNETFVKDTDMLNSLVRRISLVSSLKDTSAFTEYNQTNEFFKGQQIYKDFAEWNTLIPAVTYGANTNLMDNYATEGLHRMLSGEDLDILLYEIDERAREELGQK